jgi:hypothetical protein
MDKLQILIDLYDRGADAAEIRAAAARHGITAKDLALEVEAIEAFVRREDTRAAALESAAPLERLQMLVEEITGRS